MSFQVPSVICVNCQAPLYRCEAVGRDFIGAKLDACDFIPVAEDIPAPENGTLMVCPRCNEPYVLRGRKGGVILLLEDGSWWPHPPIDQSKKHLTYGS